MDTTLNLVFVYAASRDWCYQNVEIRLKQNSLVQCIANRKPESVLEIMEVRQHKQSQSESKKALGTQIFPRCIHKLSEVHGLSHIESRAVRVPSKSKPLRILVFHVRVGTKRWLQVYWRLRQNLASTGNFKYGTDQEGGRSIEAHGHLMLGDRNLIVYGQPYFQQPLKGFIRQWRMP